MMTNATNAERPHTWRSSRGTPPRLRRHPSSSSTTGRRGDTESTGGRAVMEKEIHLVAYTDATAFGGAEQCLATVLEHLGPRFKVTVVGVADTIVRAVAGEARADYALVPPVGNRWSLGAIREHLRVFRSLRPDVCHINLQTPYAAQYGLVAALLTRGARVVAVEHLPLHSDSKVRRWLKRQTSRRLSAHIAVGEQAARVIENEAGLRAGSIGVIRNGVPARPGDEIEHVAPSPVIGSVGRVDVQKGYDVLVDALPLVPGATAVIVGDGPARSSVEARAADVGVADRLVITGWRESVSPLLRSFDVFVLPSRYEGLPLSVLEAMEVGLPIVATDVGSVREALTAEETGLLVPPGDAVGLAGAVRRLLDDRDLRRRLGDAARARWAAEFDAATMVAAYERLYETLAR
jgi:glycosyltransferase involved in cell wall biosynthesis